MIAPIKLDDIVFDAGTQIRAAISEDVVSTYAERMQAGDAFPPVALFHDGNRYYLADGFHRTLAARRIGAHDIQANVHAGTRDDALWFALGANSRNGQRLNEQDRQHAVEIALKTWPEKMQREIAEQVGCSQSLVSKVASRVTAFNTGGETCIRGRALRKQKRLEAVREMVLAGKQSVEIRRELNVHSEMIADVRRELGLSTIDYSRAAVKARRDEMYEMAAGGYTSRQISDAVGISADRCRIILREHGIDVPGDRATGKTKRHDSNRIIEHIVMDAENLTADVALIAFDDLDPSRLAEWLDSLKASREKLGAFIRTLMKEQQKHGEAA